MEDEITDLLRRCTVALVDEEARAEGDRRGGLRGSGFFIAPNLLLTATHVVSQFDGRPISVHWLQERDLVAEVLWRRPERDPIGADVFPLPDLAVLELVTRRDLDHPCVMLGAGIPAGRILAEGYSQAVTDENDYSEETVKGEFETIRPETGGTLIRCYKTWPSPGMSGGPLLDLDSGTVVGCVKSQLSNRYKPGLYAVSLKALREHLPQAWLANRQYHQRDSRWRQAISPESTIRDREGATDFLLQHALSTVHERTRNLPHDTSRTDLHQTIWVTRVPSGSPRTVNGGELEITPGHVPTNRFRWQPLRATNNTTVIRGMPGFGKSWLLSYHVDTLARHACESIENGVDSARVPIPMLMDCAALAAELSANPSEDDVIGTLVGSLGLGAESQELASDCRLILKEAFTTGQLTVCLDGLDEVPKGHRERLGKAISHLILSPTKTLIATRHVMLDLLDDLSFEGRSDVETLGFTSREASKFVAVWLQKNQHARTMLDQALNASAQLRELSSVPLLLSFLCRLAGDPKWDGALPSSRAELYHEVVQWLLSGQWHKGDRDPESPPDPDRRMRALAGALGRIQDQWRGSGQLISRSELAAELRKCPDYDYIRATSVARWNQWNLAKGAPTAPPLAEPIIWEFIFDGLLADEPGNPRSPMVRVLHPALRELLLATYLSELDQEGWRAALERHRWFDPEWHEIFALAARLMPDRDALVEAILEVSFDPWFTQAGFAARCLAEAGSAVSRATASRVVDVLLEARRSIRPSDQKRLIVGFARLVRAGVGAAVDRAIEICRNEGDVGGVLFLETVCALAERSHEVGLAVSRDVVLAPSIPREYRQRLMQSITAHGRQEDIDFVRDLLIHRFHAFSDLRAFLAGVRPYSSVHVKAMSEFLRIGVFRVNARVAVAGTLIECGDEAVQELVRATGDLTLEWDLRCMIFSLLIDAGQTGVVLGAVELLQSPGVSSNAAAYTIEALLNAGDVSALSTAEQIASGQFGVARERRIAVMKALCSLGGEGTQLLNRQIQSSGLPPRILLDHLAVLIEHRDKTAIDWAAMLCENAVMGGMRLPLLQILLPVKPDLCNLDSMLPILSDRQFTAAQRLELAVSMANAGFTEVSSAVVEMIKQYSDEDITPRLGDNIRRLASGRPRPGHEILASLARSADLNWERRMQCLLALVRVQSRAAPDLIQELSEAEIPQPWRSQLHYELTAEGNAKFLANVIESVAAVDGAYEVLRRFMHSPSATLKDFEDIKPRLQQAMSSTAPESSPGHSIDDELMASCNLTWTSETQLNELKRWFYDQLELRVGKGLSRFLRQDQLDEFERYIDDEDEQAALEFLIAWSPNYHEFVKFVFDELRQDIVDGRLQPPVLNPDPTPQTVLKWIAIVSRHLHEMADLAAAGRWQRYFEFLRENRKILVSTAADLVLQTAMLLDRHSLVHEAHTFILRQAGMEGVDAVELDASDDERLRKRQVALLNEHSFQMLLFAGAYGTIRYRGEAPQYFYAGLGAHGDGRNDLARTLMHRAGTLASRTQIDQGTQTVRETALSNAWPEEAANALIEAMEAGFREQEAAEQEADGGDEVEPDEGGSAAA